MKNMIKKAIKIILVFALLVDITLYDSDIVLADEDNSPSDRTFLTKEELMNEFTPDENGLSDKCGKIAYGRDENNRPIEWYILGKDSGVAGDNIMIFPQYNLGEFVNGTQMRVQFKSDCDTYTEYDASLDMGIYETTPTKALAPSHYGASELRKEFRSIEERIFTATERALLNETTVKTFDEINEMEYTTTDKLYALHADNYKDTYIYIGNSNVKMDLEAYGEFTSGFWLRTPLAASYYKGYAVLCTSQTRDRYCGIDFVDDDYHLCPATNVNISSVIFASSALPATSDGILADKIYHTVNHPWGYYDDPMYLRYDGKDKNIGDVWYNADLGIITAKKDRDAKGTVAVVLQGKNESKDWYYSKTITGTEKVYISDIIEELKDKISMSSISLDECKIWIETTEDRITYAKTATSAIPVDTVAITGISEPVPMQELDTVVDNYSSEISDASIIWTCNGVEVKGDAQYSTSYIANITITLNDEYGFSSKVSATINGKTCEAKVNHDGTVTMICEFITNEKPIEETTVTQPETTEETTTEETTAEETTSEETTSEETTIEETTSEETTTEEKKTEEKTTEKATQIQESGEVSAEDDSNAKKNDNWCWIIWLIIFILILIVFIIIIILKKKSDDKTIKDNEEKSIK